LVEKSLLSVSSIVLVKSCFSLFLYLGYLPPAPTDTRGTASSDIGGRQSKTNKDFFAEDNELQLQLPFQNFLPAQSDFNEGVKIVKDNSNNNNFDDSVLYDDDYYGSNNNGDEKDVVTNPQLFQVKIDLI
jgi:hypothetical protein